MRNVTRNRHHHRRLRPGVGLPWCARRSSCPNYYQGLPCRRREPSPLQTQSAPPCRSLRLTPPHWCLRSQESTRAFARVPSLSRGLDAQIQCLDVHPQRLQALRILQDHLIHDVDIQGEYGTTSPSLYRQRIFVSHIILTSRLHLLPQSRGNWHNPGSRFG